MLGRFLDKEFAILTSVFNYAKFDELNEQIPENPYPTIMLYIIVRLYIKYCIGSRADMRRPQVAPTRLKITFVNWMKLCFLLYKIGDLCQHNSCEHKGAADPFAGGGKLNTSEECSENNGSENCKERFKAHKN